MRRIVALAAAVTMLACGTSTATAATLNDLTALGYTVARASDCQDGDVWRTVWSVSGYGVSTYLSECDPNYQAAVDSLANPAVHFERKWQHERPEQLSAAQTLAGNCYAVNRTAPMTDSWSVVGGTTDVVVAGAELPSLAAALPTLRDASGTCTSEGTSVIVPATDGSGSVTVPGEETATTEPSNGDSTVGNGKIAAV